MIPESGQDLTTVSLETVIIRSPLMMKKSIRVR